MELKEAIERATSSRYGPDLTGFSEILDAARLELARREQVPKQVSLKEMALLLEECVKSDSCWPEWCKDRHYRLSVYGDAAALLKRVGEFKKAWGEYMTPKMVRGGTYGEPILDPTQKFPDVNRSHQIVQLFVDEIP